MGKIKLGEGKQSPFLREKDVGFYCMLVALCFFGEKKEKVFVYAKRHGREPYGDLE